MATAGLQDLIPLRNAWRLAPTIAPLVRCVSAQTVYNWVRQGRNGQRLRSITIGGRAFTTKDDLKSFLSNFTQVKN